MSDKVGKRVWTASHGDEIYTYRIIVWLSEWPYTDMPPQTPS